MELRLVTGISGMHKDKVVTKIRHFLEKNIEGPNLKVGIGCVEEELVKVCLPETEDRVYYWQTRGQDRLLCLLAQLPPHVVQKFWKQAFRQAAAKAREEDPDLAVVVMCLSYYRKETREFYSPVVPDTIQGLENGAPKVGGILTLIDDIYDIYYRLSQPDPDSDVAHVFDIQNAVALELADNRGSEKTRYKKALGLVVQSLVRVLEWREKEVQASEALATVLNCREQYTLAVKHPVETGARLLLGDSSEQFGLGRTFPVYLSHPISVPRRINRETGTWPDFVGELASFVEEIGSGTSDDCHVVPIMPTAIDEFRFQRDGDMIIPQLADRWPLPCGDLLYAAVDTLDEYGEYEGRCLQSIFAPPVDKQGNRADFTGSGEMIPGILVDDPEVSGMLRTLESLIQLQMANRDHLLVRQNPGLLLYRPTSQDKDFTGGVREEIRTHNEMRRFPDGEASFGRPMAVVYTIADLKELFQSGTKFTRDIRLTIESLAREILRDRGTDTKAGDLGDETLVEALQDPTITKVAAIYAELFPATISSIADPYRPAEQDTVTRLRKAIAGARVEQLVSGMLQRNVKVRGQKKSEPWPWRHTYFDKNRNPMVEHQNMSDSNEKPVFCVGVIPGSGTEDVRVGAQHTREHFSFFCV